MNDERREGRAKPPQEGTVEPEFWMQIRRLRLSEGEAPIADLSPGNLAERVSTMAPEDRFALQAALLVAGLRAQRELWHQHERLLSLGIRLVRHAEGIGDQLGQIAEDVEDCADEFLPAPAPEGAPAPAVPSPAAKPERPARSEAAPAKAETPAASTSAEATKAPKPERNRSRSKAGTAPPPPKSNATVIPPEDVEVLLPGDK